jgi:hypothetical protein
MYFDCHESAVVEADGLTLAGRLKLIGYGLSVGRKRPITVLVECADGTHDAITATRIVREAQASDGSKCRLTSWSRPPKPLS